MAVVAAVWVLCLTPMVRNKLSIFAEALVVIADQTFFVLLCTYCVVPLLIHAMHGLFKAEEAQGKGGGSRDLQVLHNAESDSKSEEKTEEEQNQNNHHIAYGFFANVAFVVISVLILLRVTKELFGVNVSSFFNFANTLSVGIGFAFNETINNAINGLVSQVALQISRGQTVRMMQGGGEEWKVVQVGALGITLSREANPTGNAKTDANEKRFELVYVPHTVFVTSVNTILVKEKIQPQPLEKDNSGLF